MFNDRLRELREFTNPRLTQEQVAKLVKMSQRKISRLETGSVNPTPDEIISLCKFYNISADYILGLTDELKPLPKK